MKQSGNISPELCQTGQTKLSEVPTVYGNKIEFEIESSEDFTK